MSDIKKKLQDDVKAAMKSRDQLTLDTLRMVLSAIKNKEIEKKADIDDSVISSLISTLVKQRREAAELYRKGDREELAQKEEKEIVLLQAYLPEEISKDEICRIVDDGLKEAGANSLADMGKAMKVVMAKVAGRADGKVVSEVVREKLSS